MYLANISPHTRPHYVIRETYRSGEHLLSRDLCDLGPHPWRHIRYPGGNAFYIDEGIEATVRHNGGRPGIHDLEDLLWIDAARIDECFEEELCALHADAAFWDGMPPGEYLHAYLARYAIMFFDNDFSRPNVLEQMLNDYVNQHRQFRWPRASTSVSLQQASRVFETSGEALRQMSRVDITRCYRRLAQRLHPDKGGDQERFVRLTEVYQSLLRRRFN